MKKWLVLGAVAVCAVLATSSAANAEFGVGVKWTGGGIEPAMVLPIKLQSGLVIEPSFEFTNVSVDAPSSGLAADISNLTEGTWFDIGVAVEKHMDAVNGVTPFFGGDVMVSIFSPEEGDGITDFAFGLFLGGSGNINDHMALVGSWGPQVWILGEEYKDGPTATVITTRASLAVRWWLWGM